MLLILGLMLPVASQAGNWYGGIGVGSQLSDAHDDRLGRAGVGPAVNGFCRAFFCAADRTGMGGQFFGGYRYDQRWGVELGVSYLPDNVSIHSVDPVGPPPNSTIDVNQDTLVYGLKGLYTHHFNSAPRWSVSASVAANYWRSDLVFKLKSFGTTRSEVSDNGFSLGYGLKINFDINDTYRIRGSWDRYLKLGERGEALTPGTPIDINTVDNDVDLFSIQLVYRF